MASETVRRWLCGAQRPDPDGSQLVAWYCTRPPDHPADEHIAALGPYAPGVLILARWPVTPAAAESAKSAT